jgi:DNA-binding NarL/FixJ family response regulator
MEDDRTVDRPEFTECEWRTIAERLSLSPREVEIAHGVILNLKESAIAGKTGMRRSTVKTHLRRMYRKLNVQSRSDLVLRVCQAHFKR